MSRRQPQIKTAKLQPAGPEPGLPQTSTVMNDFSGGLKTEFHGLNFPPNAVTAEQNCRFTLQKEVLRRGGIDVETNFSSLTGTASQSINTYKWNNVGGDGQTQIIVTQTGGTLYFYLSSAATSSSPISANILSGQTVSLSTFLVSGSSNTPSNLECQFADGNGYLFVYNAYCEPFYVTFNSGSNTITATQIALNIRDFTGVVDGLPVNLRPSVDSNEHLYNLENQGWVAGAATPWSGASNSVVSYAIGSRTFALSSQSGTSLPNGTFITATTNNLNPVQSMSGTVTSYTSGVSVTINITALSDPSYSGFNFSGWSFTTSAQGYLGVWFTAEGNYPSNADVWWSFKNSSGAFDTTTIPNVTLATSPAPQGHYILPAFNQNRSGISGATGLTTVFTYNRPSAGCWFQGRVWYTGINANFQATGDANYYTWTENVYFSQVVTGVADFGECYQTNDPTDENFFDLLPTDGGVITIQGSGSIYELFPIQNGLIVRAANGIWFITGSQGIGFAANDYTVTKISGVESISNRPSTNVQGYPIFWNQEGIWYIMPSPQGGGLTVENAVLDTILTFYGNIPLISKKYVRGDYNPITYEIQWLYRSTVEAGLSTRYQFDTILCFNTHTKSFYHFVVSQGTGIPYLAGLNFVQGPGSITTPLPVFKYYCYNGTSYTFAQEYPSVYYDWVIQGNQTTYVSSFTTAYSLQGGAMRKFQPNYVYMFSRNMSSASYVIQGVWDYAIGSNSGRISTRQQVTNTLSTTNFAMLYRRHKVRGRGVVFQLLINSIDGQPFDFMGWALWEVLNANP